MPPRKTKSPVRRRFKTDSSNISEVGYDPTTKTLEVVFAANANEVYIYQSVGVQTYTEMLNADSIGSYFAKIIRAHPDVYPYTKRAA